MKVRCTKNLRAISFEVPPGKDPIPYAKNKLREITGKKRLVGWELETVL